MAFDWKEYLNLAKFLSGNEKVRVDREAALRSSVSRAYYAAFHHACDYAQDSHGFAPTRTGRDHGLVRKHYFNIPDLNGIANDLLDLHKWRNKCDYDENLSNIVMLCENAIPKSEKIINALT
jgi:hypothetical protein